MSEKELKDWQRENYFLQRAYQDYLEANSVKMQSSKERMKSNALERIQKSLEWPPYAEYVGRNPMAFPYGASRYGLDYITEKCICEIDMIAKGEKEY